LITLARQAAALVWLEAFDASIVPIAGPDERSASHPSVSPDAVDARFRHLGTLRRTLGTNGMRYSAGGLRAVVAAARPAEAARAPGHGLAALLAHCASLRPFVAEIIGAARS
jgi:hypothetical protein